MFNTIFIKVEENETKGSMTKKLMKEQLKTTVKNPWSYAAMAAWGVRGVIEGKSIGGIIRYAVTAGAATVAIDQGVGLILNKDLIKETGED